MRCVPRNVGIEERERDEIRPFFQKKVSNAVIGLRGWLAVRVRGGLR